MGFFKEDQPLKCIYVLSRQSKTGEKFYCIDECYSIEGRCHLNEQIEKYGIYGHEGSELTGWYGDEHRQYPIDKLEEYKQFWIKEYKKMGYKESK